MRRKDRRMTDGDARLLLESGEYGILSTLSVGNEPYGVPVNYCLAGDCIYFHCAVDGQKLKNIRHNPKVSFCVVGRTEVLPDQFATNYESCIVRGSASETFADEKHMALEGLLRKYSPSHIPEGLEYIERLRDVTRVFKISIDSISGKARKSKTIP